MVYGQLFGSFLKKMFTEHGPDLEKLIFLKEEGKTLMNYKILFTSETFHAVMAIIMSMVLLLLPIVTIPLVFIHGHLNGLLTT